MIEENVYISKLSDFMEYVENLEDGFSLSRGQSNFYELLPSAMRKDGTGHRIVSKRTAQYYLDEFKMNSYQFMNRPWDIASELEWMIYAQHYGIPTNLLDFTKSPIVSLLFAVEKAFENSKQDDGVVFFLNPFKLNNKHIRRSEIITTFNNNTITTWIPGSPNEESFVFSQKLLISLTFYLLNLAVILVMCYTIHN